MRRLIAITVTLVFLLSSTGCLFTNVTTPFDTDLDNTYLGQDVRKGEASSYSIAWLFAWGNAGTKAAAENGKLTTVNQMDLKTLMVFWGLFTRVTTVVYGK